MQKRYLRFPRLMFWYRRLQGVNDEPEMAWLDILCDRDATSVDIGAKLGMYTYRLLRHSRDVVAFEPIPLLARLLGRVFRNKPCRIESCGLSDRPGRATMRIPYGSNGEVKFGRSTVEPSNALEHDDVARVEEIEVELRTLDQHDLRSVGFLKIDVEGHELAVLRGGTETLRRERPNLLVEANDRHHPGAVSKLREFMAAHGYLGFFRQEDRLVELEPIADPDYFQRQAIENFVFVHASRPQVVERLLSRRSRP
jgi:FkbM family methyltransferase